MHPDPLHRHTHPNTHVVKQRRMTLIAGVGVASDVRGPFVAGSVCVTGADVLVLERLELLLGAEFVGLWRVLLGCVQQGKG